MVSSNGANGDQALSTRIDQLLHGYRRGHEQLAGSMKLPAKDAELVARLSDLSGTPTGPEVFSPYFTAYPLPSGSHFAVAKTWPDLHATRSGCVLTHTLLVPLGHWRIVQEPRELASLYRLPVGRDEDDAYEKPLVWPPNPKPTADDPQPVSIESSAKFVQLYFARGKRPIVWFEHPKAEDAFWRILRTLWPALRARFAVCTHCLQPRTLDDRPFDLMFADADAHPRFLKVDRENILEFKTNDSAKSIEEWSVRWAERMFGQKGSDDVLDADLFNDLDDDPTAIRRLYLIDTALRSKNDAPQAAVGAMDLVESVARESNVAIPTKAEVARRAVKIASEAKSASDSVECLRLIEDRLNRPAYSAVADDIGPLIVKAVADRTQSDPESVALLPPGSYDVGSEDNPSSFLKGIVDGFRRLIAQDDSGIVALRTLPHVSSRLFAMDPSGVQVFARALIARREEPTVRQAIHNLLAEQSVQSDLLRGNLFKEFVQRDFDFLGDLFSRLPEREVPLALNAVAPFLADDSVRKAVDHWVLKSFAGEVRKWGLCTDLWSDEIAALVAATFPASSKGLEALLGADVPADHRPPVVTHYLIPLARGHFPAWTRQIAVEDQRLFAALLDPSLKADDRADALVTQLLNECHDLRLAHCPSILSDIGNHKGRRFHSQLLDSVYSDLVRGYLDGIISEDSCLPMIQSGEMSNWLLASNHATLTSLLTYQIWNSRENWLNAWKLLLVLPMPIYNREPSVMFNAIDGLVRAYSPAWSPVIAHTWTRILQRSRNECTSLRVLLQLEVQAFKHAIYNSRYPLSEVVVETFQDIYRAVTSSSHVPAETSPLFGMLDWDKGKELRKTLIDTFMGSKWPPGDLALASSEPGLFRKIFKRIYRKSSGPRYLETTLVDLQGRASKEAKQMAVILSSLLRDPDFYEDWD
jgi:hypothetical protein